MSHDIVKTIKKLKEVNKSFIFLYPILQLDINIKPLGVYLGFKGFEHNKMIICMFHRTQPDHVLHMKMVKDNKHYDVTIEDGDYRYVTFDFTRMPNIYKAVKNGSYSSIEGNARTILTLSGKELVLLGLYPEKYYEEFSVEFEYPIEMLIENVELISPPDIDNEYLSVSKTIRLELNEMY